MKVFKKKGYKIIQSEINLIYEKSCRLHNDKLSSLQYAVSEVKKYLSDDNIVENDLLKLHKKLKIELNVFNTNMTSLVISLFGSAIFGLIMEMSDVLSNIYSILNYNMLLYMILYFIMHFVIFIVLYISLIFVIRIINNKIFGYKNVYYYDAVVKLIEERINKKFNSLYSEYAQNDSDINDSDISDKHETYVARVIPKRKRLKAEEKNTANIKITTLNIKM